MMNVYINFENHHHIRPSCKIPEARENVCVLPDSSAPHPHSLADTRSEIRARSGEAAGQ